MTSKPKQKQQPAQATDATTRDGVRAYFDNALLENQPRLTDLIPKSLWAYLAMLLLGGISIYACQQAFLHTRDLDSTSFPTHLFEISGPGNVASWLHSVTLLMLAVGATMVYLLRRHKTDDYSGRYRLWLHLALFAGVLSIESATGLHEILVVPLAQTDFTAPWNQASVWAMLLVALGAIYLTIRLLVEFKSRPGMLVLLSTSAIILIAACCSRLGDVIGESALTSEVAQSSLVLSGALLVCLMTWLNARKIYRHAQQGAVEQTSVAAAKTQSSASPVQVNEKEVDAVLEEQPVEDPQWDDWDELDDEVVEDETIVYEEYEDEIEEDEADQEVEEVVYEDPEFEEEVEYEEVAEVEQEVEQEVDEPEQYETEEESEYEAEPEEVIYSAYAQHDEPSSDSESEYASTAYETPADDSHQSSPLIPPQTQQPEKVYEPFDEDSFWEQYDLTKMSRKQLKTMRKKLNRLKRKHAEKQRAA